ncbi:MAG: BlaI/MecI/CopY family transcriptional regulator [Pirellulaceae bacterium]
MVREESISPAEWKVIHIVWKLQPCATRDVVSAAEAQHGWSPSTVKTLLKRLVDKGQLKTRQVGNSFLYRPTRPAIKTLCQAADRLLNHAVDGTVGPLLMYMARRGQLTRDELAELRATFEELAERNEGPDP